MNEADKKYIALCDEVKRQAMRIMGTAHNGNADNAANLALSLADYVSTEREQTRMKQERAGTAAYDLSALKVDAATASNSETGWERED